MKIIHTLIHSFILALILFAIYVEVNPEMTNIWWRIDSNNNKRLVISNLFRLIFAPLQFLFYWNPNAWDINFFIWWFLIFIICITYERYI